MERVTKGFCNPRISIAKDPLRCNSRSEQAHKTTSLNVEPRTSYHALVGRMPRTTRWTHLLISESFQLCNQVLGIQGKHRTINSKPTSSCIHPSTHNQLFSETVYLGPSKRIHYTSYGNTPELPPQYWVMSGLSCHWPYRRDFRCRSS